MVRTRPVVAQTVTYSDVTAHIIDGAAVINLNKPKDLVDMDLIPYLSQD